MKVLVVGKGGREHALVWKISKSPRVTKLFAAPGSPGIETLAECLDIGVDATVNEIDKLKAEIERLRDFAVTEEIDLTVVGSGGYCFGVYLKLSQASFYGQNTCRIIATARKHASAPLHIPANRCDALTSLISHQHFLETLATSI